MYEVLLVLSVVIFAGTAAAYLRAPAASVFHPVTFYLAFHSVLFVIRPIFGYFYDYDSMYLAIGFTPTLWDKTRVLICTNIALLVFTTVALMVAREPIPFRKDPLEPLQRQALLERFWFIAIPLGALGLYALYWHWQFRLSGEFLVYIDNVTGNNALQSGSGYLIAAGSAFGVLTAILPYLAGFRLWSLAPFAAFSVLKLGTGGRGDFVVVGVMLALLYLFRRQRKWPGFQWLLPAVAVVTIFQVIGADRGASLREAVGFDIRNDIYADVQAKEVKPLEAMDLANMEFFEFLMTTIPDRTGTYDYFLHNLEIFTAPIPRTFWKEKPVGPPIRRFELYRYGVPLGITYAVPGVGWYSLGYIGVVVWTALFAVMYGFAHRTFARSSQSPFATMAYIFFISTAVVGLRDGILLSILKQSFNYLGPVILLLIFARMTGYRNDSPTPLSWRASVTYDTRANKLSEQTPRELRQHAGKMAGSLAVPGERQIPILTPRQRRLARMHDA